MSPWLAGGRQPGRAVDRRITRTAGLRCDCSRVPRCRLGVGARARLTRLLGALNADDPISLADTQRAAHEEIMDTPIPAEITNAIEEAYRRSEKMSP